MLVARLLNGLDGKRIAENVTRHHAGRSALKERVAQPALQERLQAASLHGVFAARIERLAPALTEGAHR